MPRLAGETSAGRGNRRNLVQRALGGTGCGRKIFPPRWAAPLAAEKYGLKNSRAGHPGQHINVTRFIVLGRQCSPPTGDDRTSLMLSVADRAGALHEAISVFRKFKINMTKIESRPSKRIGVGVFFLH